MHVPRYLYIFFLLTCLSSGASLVAFPSPILQWKFCLQVFNIHSYQLQYECTVPQLHTLQDTVELNSGLIHVYVLFNMLFTHCWWMLTSDDKTGAMHVRLARELRNFKRHTSFVIAQLLYLTAKASLHMAVIHWDDGIVRDFLLSALFQ